jgi:predicted Zn-dependent peptidase
LSEADLVRAKNIYRATAVSARERPADIAALLQHAALFHKDADAVNTEPDRVLAVSLPEVRRVARAWLAPERALTLTVMPEEAS